MLSCLIPLTLQQAAPLPKMTLVARATMVWDSSNPMLPNDVFEETIEVSSDGRTVRRTYKGTLTTVVRTVSPTEITSKLSGLDGRTGTGHSTHEDGESDGGFKDRFLSEGLSDPYWGLATDKREISLEKKIIAGIECQKHTLRRQYTSMKTGDFNVGVRTTWVPLDPKVAKIMGALEMDQTDRTTSPGKEPQERWERFRITKFEFMK